MPTEIKLKRSSGSSDVPSLSDLAVGELAINTYHGRLYTEKNDGSLQYMRLVLTLLN